jgi:hypothetical protein
MRPLWRPAPWHLAVPPTTPPKRAPEFLVTGLFTAGSDDRYLLMCGDCGGTMTAPSAKVNEMNCSVPSCRDEGSADA